MYVSKFLTKLRYNTNETTVSDISSFMLTNDNHKAILKASYEELKEPIKETHQEISLKPIEKIEKQPEKPKIQEKSIYSPNQQDGLFWCFYIIDKGYNDYISIDRNYGIVKLETKQKICNFV
jgi:hypothetical protein